MVTQLWCGINLFGEELGDMGELAADLDVGPDWDADEVAEVTQRLRVELLDVDGVDLRAEEAEPGSKGIGLLGIGGLIIRLAIVRMRPDLRSGARSLSPNCER
jgi:hypothetical protein